MKAVQKPTQNIIKAYDTINQKCSQIGTFHKACFHVHTPASYDYRLLSEWSIEQYKRAYDEEIYDLCIKKRVIPYVQLLDNIDLEDGFNSKKELLSFVLLANSIYEANIEIVLVTDHNTIDGIKKLNVAIDKVRLQKGFGYRPTVLAGVEISCADKLHVVGIFEDIQEKQETVKAWLHTNLLSPEDGTYETSLAVMEFFKKIDGIAYVAHINSSEVFQGKIGSGAYKEKLFGRQTMDIVGISEYSQRDRVRAYFTGYNNASIKMVIDNDAHNIDILNENCFWIKGGQRNYAMVKEALADYDISVSLTEEQQAQRFIKGLYIEPWDDGFLRGNKDGNEPFCIGFSSALNCIIGGRGTGKSTILELLEYVMSQRCETKKQLEFLCEHSNVWVLYVEGVEEYLIHMIMPKQGEFSKGFLDYFGNGEGEKYRRKYHEYDKQSVQEYARTKYLSIYKIIHSDNSWEYERVKNKDSVLASFFDTTYSVNSLVKTASGYEINDFIYKTLFDNKTISKIKSKRGRQTSASLLKYLKEVEATRIKRKEEVEEVVNAFNASQKGALRIVYSQSGHYQDPQVGIWAFGNFYNKNGFFEPYNIKRESVVEYLLALYDKVGMIEFFSIVLKGESLKAQQNVDITEFSESHSTWAVDNSIIEINPKNAEVVLKSIFKAMINNDEKMKRMSDYIKQHATQTESFSLEFNVSSREGCNEPPNYKPVDELSLGQKVVAMLSFILGYSAYSNDYRPLIIDQPEDNLDSQYIYRHLVKTLRSVKEMRQVIIATHNATIVTNAKADQICVMESDNNHGWIKATGYPSEVKIKKHILNYLEGGKDSFKHKMETYKEALK